MSLILKQLDKGEYVARGSLVVRVLQGNGIDDLIRESIQNSLDAAEIQAKYINVDFTINSLNKNVVAHQFDKETARRIKGRFDNAGECRLLAIRDTGTTGLTGDYEDENSKMYKLVRDIGRAQDSAGAGGSWGLGKTIFYNVGPGIVGYYTRTKQGSNKYREQLIFSCIENEKKVREDQRITTSPTGIAWWLGKNGKPVANRSEIAKILDNFQISPFEKDETGTVVIIPFFGQSRSLLPRNTLNPAPWEQDEASYIKMAIQRWYSNRLVETRGKCLLLASVNSLRIGKCEPAFKVNQSLKNLIEKYKSDPAASGGLPLRTSKDNEGGEESFEPCTEDIRRTAYVKAIRIKGQIKDSEPAGWLAARLLRKSDLGMIPPSNKLSPHKYFFGSQAEIDERLPVVAMCRGPHMIVAYDTEKWRSGLRLEDENEFLIALFILNSNATTKDGTKLEEYIRSIENPTHSDWEDNMGTPIPKRIKTNVCRALKEAFFSSEDVIDTGGIGEAIRAQLGEALLPSGFGKSGTAGNPGRSGGGDAAGGAEANKSVRQPKLTVTDIDYRSSSIVLSLTINPGVNAGSKVLILSVVADSGSGKTVSKESWENEDALNDTKFPFKVSKFDISKLIISPKKGKSIMVKDTGNWTAFDVKDNGVRLENKENVSELTASMTLEMDDRTVMPVLTMGLEDGRA